MGKFREVYLIQVLTPDGKWTRVGNPYLSKENAKSWVPFVKSAWCGSKTRTKTVRVALDEKGRPTDAAIAMFDAEFNIDLK